MKLVVVISLSALLVASFHESPLRVRVPPDVQGACDTITIPGVTHLKFIPLDWYLNGLELSTDERRWVDLGIRAQRLDMDSLWIQPDHEALSSDQLELPLCHISGLRKQIDLMKQGRMVIGNWSGKDGTLVVERKTGSTRFLMWQ